jgi:hypothetical protein
LDRLTEDGEHDHLNKVNDRLIAEKKQYEDDAQAATLRLFNDIIPRLAQQLPGIIHDLCPSELRMFVENDWLSVVVHYYGVNLRHLGLLRQAMSSNLTRSLVLIEMIARLTKRMLFTQWRQAMRESGYPGEEPYKRSAIEFLNLVFGLSERSAVWWSSVLKPQLNSVFPSSLTSEELSHGDLKSSLLYSSLEVSSSTETTKIPVICVLFKKVSTLCGVDFTDTLTTQFSTHPSLFDTEAPFDVIDIMTLRERTKTLQLIAHSQGVVLRTRASAAIEKRGQAFADVLIRRSLDKFEASLRAVPRDQRTLRNTSEIFEALKMPNLAELFFMLALQVNPMDSVTLYKYASFLQKSGQAERAEEMFEHSIYSPDGVTAGAYLKVRV